MQEFLSATVGRKTLWVEPQSFVISQIFGPDTDNCITFIVIHPSMQDIYKPNYYKYSNFCSQ